MAETWTLDQAVSRYFQDWEDGEQQLAMAKVTRDQLIGWLAAGKGIAVYENHDMSHSMMGAIKLVSFGTLEAQLEVDDPPEQLPDIGDQINWRYLLIATVPKEDG